MKLGVVLSDLNLFLSSLSIVYLSILYPVFQYTWSWFIQFFLFLFSSKACDIFLWHIILFYQGGIEEGVWGSIACGCNGNGNSNGNAVSDYMIFAFRRCSSSLWRPYVIRYSTHLFYLIEHISLFPILLFTWSFLPSSLPNLSDLCYSAV